MRLDSTVPDFDTFSVNVTSTPTLLKAASGEGPKLHWRIKAAGPMRVGSFPLEAGEEVKLPVHGPIYLVADSPTTCRVLKA
jgi:hypothetical protein